MASAIKRLATEYRSVSKPENRVCDYYAAPLEDNIYEWHFTIRGPSVDSTNRDLPYKEGIYHGRLTFPLNYPFEPPDIYFFTPNGRFKLNTKLCSTISSFHKELWRPTYDVDLILTSLRLFMGQENEIGVGSIGRAACSDADKRIMATESWNYECKLCGCRVKDVWRTFMEPYPATGADKITAVPTLTPGAAARTLAHGEGEGEEGEGAEGEPGANERDAAAASAARTETETKETAGEASTKPASAYSENETEEERKDTVSPSPVAAAPLGTEASPVASSMAPAVGEGKKPPHPATEPSPAATAATPGPVAHQPAPPAGTTTAPDTPMREDRRVGDVAISSTVHGEDTLPTAIPVEKHDGSGNGGASRRDECLKDKVEKRVSMAASVTATTTTAATPAAATAVTRSAPLKEAPAASSPPGKREVPAAVPSTAAANSAPRGVALAAATAVVRCGETATAKPVEMTPSDVMPSTGITEPEKHVCGGDDDAVKGKGSMPTGVPSPKVTHAAPPPPRSSRTTVHPPRQPHEPQQDPVPAEQVTPAEYAANRHTNTESAEKMVQLDFLGATLAFREAALTRVAVTCLMGICLIVARRVVFRLIGVSLS